MKISVKWSFLVALATIAIIVAFMLGYYFADVTLEDSTSFVVKHQSPETSLIDDERKSDHRSVKTLRELFAIHRLSNLLDRTVALYELLNQADQPELIQYWNESEDLEIGFFQQEIQDTIVQRWSVLDPIEVLSVVFESADTTRQNDRLSFVFREWSHTNLDKLVQHALEFDTKIRELVVRSIMHERDDLLNSELREIARLLDSEWLVLKTNDELIEHPELEWKQFIDLFGDDFNHLSPNQRKVLEHLAYQWILQDGSGIFQRMRGSVPVSFSLQETTKNVALRMFEVEPSIAINLVIDRILYKNDASDHQLAEDLIGRWAKADARGAFNLTAEIERSGLRRRLEFSIVRSLVKHDPVKLLNDMDEFPDYLQSYVQEWVYSEISQISPHQARELVNKIAQTPVHRFAATNLVKGWAKVDLTAALHWINTEPSVAHLQEVLTSTTIRSLAESDPSMSMKIALERPLSESGVGLEFEAIDSLSWSDEMDIAISFLPQVREGKTRGESYNSIISRLNFRGENERAFDLFLELSENQSDFLDKPLRTIASDSPRLLYKSLEDIEDLAIRAEAARLLYRYHKHNGQFIDSEIIELRQLIESQPESQLREVYDRLNKIMNKAE